MSGTFNPEALTLTIVSGFVSAEHLELLSVMGVEAGMREAMSQIDAVFLDDAACVVRRQTGASRRSDLAIAVAIIAA